MKPISISAEALFEQHRTALRWQWVAGHAHPERPFDEAAVRDAHSAADLVGGRDRVAHGGFVEWPLAQWPATHCQRSAVRRSRTALRH